MRAGPMRSEEEIHAALTALGKREEALLVYRNECIRIEDHHGVQDASSDLREIEMVHGALFWVLGTLPKLCC